MQYDGGRIGYIFPISVLLSNEDYSDYKGLERYVFAAFHILLQRLPKITNQQDFVKNFEDNIIVAVFDYKKLPPEISEPIGSCIHYLRKHGYTYFEDNNNIQEVPGYDFMSYSPQSKRINIKFTIPPLYKENIIDSLLREYPKVSNVPHRFIILYQVIEYLMEIFSKNEILAFIDKYMSGLIPNNDFTNDLKSLTSEKSKINSIFNNTNICDHDFTRFNDKYSNLKARIVYDPSTKTKGEIFYSFRNILLHKYRTLHEFEKELAETVQEAELLILTIVERYKIER